LFVGGSGGEGALEITDGALVQSNADTQVAVGFDGFGTVTIDGTNSRWDVPGVLYVGKLGGGEGTLYVINGGFLNSQTTGFGILGRDEGSTGNVIIQGVGSKWTATGGLGYVRVGDGGAASLTVEDGGTVETANVYIGQLGELRGDGNVIADVQNSGVVSPGTSPGALNIDGDYTQTAAGVLLIDLASASVFDQLVVGSDATLAGTLTVNLLEGFIPDTGQTFTILTAGEVINYFATEPISPFPNLEFDVIYNADSVVLTVLPALAGDYNGDGSVNAADYTVWRNTLGQSGLALAADGTGASGNPDGIVDRLDYEFWKTHYGESLGSGATANAAVPEPAARWLALAALFGCLLIVSPLPGSHR
jgi:T5SS/PEP-CTERM-associated repeat protein